MDAESGQPGTSATQVAGTGSAEEKPATSGDVGTSAAGETAASSDVVAISESDHKEIQGHTTEPPAAHDEVVAEAQQKADAAVEQRQPEQRDSSKQDGVEPHSRETEQAHASTEQVQIGGSTTQPADQPCPAAEGSQTAGEDSDQKSSENVKPADIAGSVPSQDTPAQATETQEQPQSEQPENTGPTDEHTSTATTEVKSVETTSTESATEAKLVPEPSQQSDQGVDASTADPSSEATRAEVNNDRLYSGLRWTSLP